MSNLSVIPYSELIEILQMEMIRDNSVNIQSRYVYARNINDAYRITIPMEYDWNFLRKTAVITTELPYTDGTISISQYSTTVTGSGTNFTSDMVGRKLIVSSYVYTISAVTNATTLTISEPHNGSAISGSSYKIIKYRYSLASDFFFPISDPKSFIYYMLNGSRVYLEPLDEVRYNENVSYTLDNYPAYYKIYNGDNEIEIMPVLSSQKINLYYEYIPLLTPMKEEYTGYVTATDGSTSIVGTNTVFTRMSAGDYFRINLDGTGSKSVWYKVASITDDTHLTLETAYNGINRTDEEYVISEVPQYYPAAMCLAIVYKAAMDSAISTDDKTQFAYWTSMYQSITGKYRTLERKSYYLSRITSDFKRLRK